MRTLRKITRLIILTAAVTLTAVSGRAQAPVSQPGARMTASEAIPPAELEAFVDGVVGHAMARDHIAGAAGIGGAERRRRAEEGLRLREP